MTWLEGPMYALDTETTSADPEQARILTACIGLSERPGQWDAMEFHMNPGAPVGDSQKVHGISDEQAAQWPEPEEALRILRRELVRTEGRPIVGHNLAFDCTVLDREFRRHLGEGLPEGLVFIDTLVLYRRLDMTTGSRRLEKLAERAGITFPAHDSAADSLASLRILHILAMRVDFLPRIPLSDLQDLQARWYAEQQQHAEDAAAGTGRAGFNRHWPLIPHRTEEAAA